MNPEKIQTVVVIGSGTMGPNIAQTFARAVLDFFLVDIWEIIMERGLRQKNILLLAHERFRLF